MSGSDGEMDGYVWRWVGKCDGQLEKWVAVSATAALLVRNPDIAHHKMEDISKGVADKILPAKKYF
jgi:hypothetical protein